MTRGLAICITATGAALVTTALGILAVALVGDVRAFGVVVVVAAIVASSVIARKERAESEAHQRRTPAERADTTLDVNKAA